MHRLIRPWRHMFDFNGRATRREYWLFQLQWMFLFVAGATLLGAVMRTYQSPVVVVPGSLIDLALTVALCVANLALIVRRLHDHDKSGWFYLVALFPFFGWIFFLIMMLTPGTPGENSYGYDPREGDEPPPEEVAAVFS